MRQIASALDAAHAQGLVHRDVKPANILMTSDPQHAYLTDFGIAKHLDAHEGLTGRRLGRDVDYLAPEIVDGEEASPRSDVYALAAVLFYGVTGACRSTCAPRPGSSRARQSAAAVGRPRAPRPRSTQSSRRGMAKAPGSATRGVRARQGGSQSPRIRGPRAAAHAGGPAPADPG